MTDLVATLHEIVDIPSVIGDEGRLCTAIEERMLATWGREGVERIGNSLVVGRRSGRPLISLYGHIDTVPNQGQGPARVENGRMFGLGTTDMKGGVAVMMHLLEDPAVQDGPYDVVGVFYDGEEGPIDRNGLGPVLDHADWLRASEFAVVMEPTDNELHVGCQGFVNSRLIFEGHAAHSARPWLGSNAITKAGAFLSEMHDRRLEPRAVDGQEYTEVFSITLAKGGAARNIIPERFELWLNHRFPPDLSVAEAVERTKEVAAAADAIEVDDVGPGGSVAADNPHLQRLAAISGASVKGKQGWTDAARLNAVGVPAINYGPGEVALAHQVAESIPLDNLTESYRAMRELLTAG